MKAHARDSKAIATAALLLLCSIAAAAPVSQTVTRNFQETDELLVNPGIGLSDFHNESQFPTPAEARPTGKLAYYRFSWSSIETAPGTFNTSAIDQALATAASRGQTLGLRIMSATGDHTGILIPNHVKQAADAAGGAGTMFPTTGTPQYFLPNYDNPVIVNAASDFLTELGRRYGNNPTLSFVDVGMVGLWGEWHDGGGGSAYMPTLENAKKYVDMHKTAFPTKRLAIPVGTGKPQSNALLQYAAETHSIGWRADCWGDYRFFDMDPSMNGRFSVYPKILTAVPALDETWKQHPVLFESCGPISSLFGLTYTRPNGTAVVIDQQKMQEMVDFAVAHHVSSINTERLRAAIPQALRPMFQQMLRSLGYRFVLRQVQHPDPIINGQVVQLRSTWENVGNAPMYDAFRIAYRLRRADGAIVKQWISPANLRAWLPGEGTKTDTVGGGTLTLTDAPAGMYKLDIAILWPQANTPAVTFAVEGKRDDGWYEVSQLELINP